MGAKAVLIFDGDDTLWKTMPLYIEAKEKFFKAMQREGFSRISVESFFEKRDRRNVKTLGFSRRRFGISMQQTYRHFCCETDRPPRRSVQTRIVTIRDRVFGKKAKLVPSARSVLRSLMGRNRLVLLTKGSSKVQLRRVSSSGLSHFFEKILVVQHKNRETFRDIVHMFNVSPANTWSVGDSIRSDINPALQSGLNAIWIPQANWGYEEGIPRQSERFYKVHSLKQVNNVLKSVNGN
jgi:putative hydrolase of the HAD superfamily